MGWAERCNPNSGWNRKRAMNMSSSIASPISSEPKATVSTPIKRDEPMVIEITPRSLWMLFKEFLCRLKLAPKPPQSPAPTS